MKKFKQVVSDDALTIIVEGDKRNPEPMHLIIKFPGGNIELARCSDGSYWAHTVAENSSNIINSRIDYEHGASVSVASLPDADKVHKLSLRIAKGA